MINKKDYEHLLHNVGDFVVQAEHAGEDGDKILSNLRKKLKNFDDYHDENARGAAILKSCVGDLYKKIARPAVLGLLDAVKRLAQLPDSNQQAVITDILNSLELERYLASPEEPEEVEPEEIAAIDAA